MDALAGILYAAAALLVVAGGAKLVAPAPTASAVRAVGLPAPLAAVRLLGLVEVAVGVAAVAAGGRVAAVLVAAHYAAFTVFAGVALRRGGAVRSCGCFGTDDTPATAAHLLVNAVAAAVAAVVAVRPVGGLVATLAEQPAAGLPFLAATAACAWLAYATLTALPAVTAARTSTGRP